MRILKIRRSIEQESKKWTSKIRKESSLREVTANSQSTELFFRQSKRETNMSMPKVQKNRKARINQANRNQEENQHRQIPANLVSTRAFLLLSRQATSIWKQGNQKREIQRAKKKTQKNQRVKERFRENQRVLPERARIRVLRNLIDLLEAKAQRSWITKKGKAQAKGEDHL